jgi:hypothetical protein
LHVAPLAVAVLLAAAAPAMAKRKVVRAGEPAQPVMAPVVQPPAGAPLPPGRAAVRPFDDVGTVRSVTTQRAYLDAGSREGLAAGQELALSRKGRPAGSCTVEAVAERNATCAGTGLRAGDTFAVNPKAAGLLPVQLRPLPTREEQARRLAAVRAAAFAPIEHKGKMAPAPAERTRHVEVGLAHVTWAAVDAGAVHQERVYAVVRDAEVLGSARLNLDLTVLYRPNLPSSERFLPGRETLVWLREASLAWGQGQGPFRLAGGRVLPWLVPGGPTFDGLQAGWRPFQGGELGVFGGAVPNPMTTEPGLDRATAGTYWAWEAFSGTSLFRQEARFAWVQLAPGETRLEAEAAAQAWVARRIDVSARARFGFGSYVAPAYLDAAWIDLGWHQPGVLSVAGGFRYDENRIPDTVAPALLPGRTRHAWGSATWEGSPALQVRIAGGHARDMVSGQERTWVGPELAAPRVLGSSGGLAAGYAEEFGAQAGRNAWVQGDLAPLPGTRLLARASWFMDHRPAPLPSEQVFGLLLSGAADLSGWMRLRLSLLGRYALPLNEAAGDNWGASALVGLEAKY